MFRCAALGGKEEVGRYCNYNSFYIITNFIMLEEDAWPGTLLTLKRRGGWAAGGVIRPLPNHDYLSIVICCYVQGKILLYCYKEEVGPGRSLYKYSKVCVLVVILKVIQVDSLIITYFTQNHSTLVLVFVVVLVAVIVCYVMCACARFPRARVCGCACVCVRACVGACVRACVCVCVCV